jgi:hypothetical protein
MPRPNKHAALAKFKAAKARRLEGTDNVLDAAAQPDDNDGDDDMYDYLDETAYQNLVNARREREDFVVDDDGLGYYDDGEERYGAEATENEQSQKKRTGAAATLTQQALKKARKTAAANRKAAVDSLGGADGAAAGTENNKSMWEFVNRGGAATVSTKRAPNAATTTKTTNVDALLEQLDEPLVSKQRNRNARRRSTAVGARGSSGGRSQQPQSRQRARRAAAPAQQPRGGIQVDDDEDDDDIGNGPSAFDDDDDDHDMAGSTVDSPQATTAATGATDAANKSVTFAEDAKESAPTPIDTTDYPKDADTATAVAPRRRLVRPKLGQISAPAKQAADQKQQAAAVTAAATVEKKILPAVDPTAASFQPSNIASEQACAATGPTSSSAGQMELAAFLQTPPPVDAAVATATAVKEDAMDTDQPKVVDQAPYVDMFWTDLQGKNGTIYLFGKVAAPASGNVAAADGTAACTKYVSACAIVTGNLRNMFVLPRTMTDGSTASMTDLHSEVNGVLHKGIIPHAAGASWAGKVVKRNYAFEDSEVPREERDYLKVVYDAKYPVPPEEVCLHGGEHFCKILGAGASVTENFIVKRKLMGPCWVRIRQPAPSKAPSSWCKLEMAVDSPKSITRLDLEKDGAARSPPPVVTMSIKLKTIVNPKTHKSEIVSISALCHKNVMLETASDESPKHMVQLSLIRPLGDPATSGLLQFPRDIDDAIAAGMPQLRREPNERAMLSRLFAQIGQWDPDVIVGHNAWGYDMEVLLTRCIELKVMGWSKIGRRRKTQLPAKTFFSSHKDMAIADAVAGRLLCDTYLSAKELLRETTYSLTNLAATQLKTSRQEIEPVDIPQWFNSSKTIVQLALSTLFDVELVQRLMFKMQVLPLSKQLTCIAGNIWSHTLKSNRAERTEYLLLHEFRRLKFLPPEKRRPGKRNESNKSKAKYSGGLVLEPKKGLYDSFILLLDFNSLYPSIIQEYNLCFTTVDWTNFSGGEAIEGEDPSSPNKMPPLPDESVERGVLPRVIKSLVERRRAVKKMMKNEKNAEKKAEVRV